jgi:hypothetical protein
MDDLIPRLLFSTAIANASTSTGTLMSSVFPGRYHIDTCVALCEERTRALKEGHFLQTIQGISIPTEAIFRKPLEPVLRPAKIDGFVVSSSLCFNDLDPDSPKRKGYVTCLACGVDVWAPNSARHREICAKNYLNAALANTVHSATGTVVLNAFGSAANEVASLEKLFCDEILPDDDGAGKFGAETSRWADAFTHGT